MGELSNLVQMLFQIVLDMGNFIIIVILVIVSFGLAFNVLHSTHSDEVSGVYSTLSESLFTTYLFALFGDMGAPLEHIEHSASPFLNLCMFVTLQILVTIVMLNAVIAMMGDTFEKMQDCREESMWMNRCELVVEFMSKGLTPEDLNSLNAAFQWIHVLEPRTFAMDQSSGGDWSGRIKLIRNMVSTLDDKICKNQDYVQKRFEHLEDKLTEIGQRQADKEATATQLLHQLKESIHGSLQAVVKDQMKQVLDAVQQTQTQDACSAAADDTVPPPPPESPSRPDSGGGSGSEAKAEL